MNGSTIRKLYSDKIAGSRKNGDLTRIEDMALKFSNSVTGNDFSVSSGLEISGKLICAESILCCLMFRISGKSELHGLGISDLMVFEETSCFAEFNGLSEFAEVGASEDLVLSLLDSFSSDGEWKEGGTSLEIEGIGIKIFSSSDEDFAGI